MPELPEVETTRRGLEPHLRGARILHVQANRYDLRQAMPEDIASRLEGQRIRAIRRRAKYLLFDLESDVVMLAHLGMSGTFTLIPSKDYQPRKHDHIWFDLDNGQRLVFHDPRRFGLILLLSSAEEGAHPLLKHLGYEPLSNDFHADALYAGLSKRSSSIKVALMDQELVVGVGNIYASESLFLARIDPRMKASKAASHSDAIVDAIRVVLNAAIASGGSTLRDYVRSSGDAGYFQHEFKVYDREGECCVDCSEPVTRIVQAARSTYFCATCQTRNTTRAASRQRNRTKS